MKKLLVGVSIVAALLITASIPLAAAVPITLKTYNNWIFRSTSSAYCHGAYFNDESVVGEISVYCGVFDITATGYLEIFASDGRRTSAGCTSWFASPFSSASVSMFNTGSGRIYYQLQGIDFTFGSFLGSCNWWY